MNSSWSHSGKTMTCNAAKALRLLSIRARCDLCCVLISETTISLQDPIIRISNFVEPSHSLASLRSSHDVSKSTLGTHRKPIHNFHA